MSDGAMLGWNGLKNEWEMEKWEISKEDNFYISCEGSKEIKH